MSAPHEITDGWALWSPLGFLRDVVLDHPGEREHPVEATLRCRPREEVGSRLWWELTWRDAQGKERVAEASSISLLMERATTMEREARRWDQP